MCLEVIIVPKEPLIIVRNHFWRAYYVQVLCPEPRGGVCVGVEGSGVGQRLGGMPLPG